MVDVQGLIEVYRGGASLRECGSRFGISYEWVRQTFKKNGISYRREVHTVGYRVASRISRQAVASGDLTRGLCEVCGKSNTVGHHDDYRLPMSVRWLCSKHHTQWHLANRAIDVDGTLRNGSVGRPVSQVVCRICGRKAHAKHLCQAHYRRPGFEGTVRQYSHHEVDG